MAEASEEIIIIEEEEAAGSKSPVSTDKEDTQTQEPQESKKTLLIGVIVALVVVIIAAIIIIILNSGEDKKPQAQNFVEEKLNFKPKKSVPKTSQVEKMIAKANLLYAKGQTQKALEIYEKIAQYSEAISEYNLGVAQFKEEEYTEALETFKRAINNGDNACVSALNAAVCSLHLGDYDKFKYYLELSEAYLPQESTSTLYSYYYALINYYKGDYYEVLSALKHPTSEYYSEISKHLLAKIDTLFFNYYEAINTLEEDYQESDAFELGLLYANIGDLTLAKKYLNQAIILNSKPIKEQLALSYINIKSGQHAQAGKLLKDISDMYGEEVYTYYPIKVRLRKSLYDSEASQQYYRNTLLKRKSVEYQKIFYFAPFKIFNATRTISYIRKGTANMFIDDIQGAKSYLNQSSKTSSVNYAIAQAISKALNFKIREANQQLKALLALNPKHSILHYNLALTYAQMNNIPLAYKHFLRSYHLDAKNYLAGIFAAYSAQIINKDTTKMLSILKEDLALEDESEEFDLYRTLLDISSNNLVSSIKWLDNHYKERPLYIFISTLIASRLGKDDIALKNAQKLTILQKHDLIPHIIYADLQFKDMKPKAYAKAMLNYFKKSDFSFNDLYYGPFITRYLYSTLALSTGKIYALKEKVKNKYETSTKNTVDIIQLLALLSIYTQEYETAYTLYNQLIDNYKLRTPTILFLGAVASIGASHHSNAIALLELSKLKNPNFLESRFALALLYLEAKNNHAASIQFHHIGDSGFISEYFNFDIDTQKLLFQKQFKGE